MSLKGSYEQSKKQGKIESIVTSLETNAVLMRRYKMGWRPDKWRPDKKEWANQRRIFFESHLPQPPRHQTRRIDYEAGADAMLEAIWKLAKEAPTGTFIFDSNMKVVI